MPAVYKVHNPYALYRLFDTVTKAAKFVYIDFYYIYIYIYISKCMITLTIPETTKPPILIYY